MRTQLWRIAVVVFTVIALGGCHGRESITGGYGEGAVVGQVTMAAGMINSSPAGVRVGVDGAGMSAVLGTDGRFTFVGVPENATLHFSRADGVDARLAISVLGGPMNIELSANGARVGRHRVAPSTPLVQFEGLVKTVLSPTQIVVSDSHKVDVTVTITTDTIIRHGDQALTPSDLQVGDRVHVKAKVIGTDNVAVEIMLQNAENGDDGQGGQTMTANGLVTGTDNGQITVASQPHGDVVVMVDANTIIRKQGVLIKLEGIHLGDEVNAMGTRIDDHTLQALQIEVRGVSGRH
jgi:hypothetical protein